MIVMSGVVIGRHLKIGSRAKARKRAKAILARRRKKGQKQSSREDAKARRKSNA
jgi:hypothetical protein